MDKFKFSIVVVLSFLISAFIFLLVAPELYPDVPYGERYSRIVNGKVQYYYNMGKTPEREIFEFFTLSLIFVIPAIYYLLFSNKK